MTRLHSIVLHNTITKGCVFLTNYELLAAEAYSIGLTVKEKPLYGSDGLIKGRRIAIRQDIPTLAKKADVLAEELGHYYTTVGNILDQENVGARKQERAARIWAYNLRIPLLDLVKAYKAHCQNTFEMAEYLDVSEDTLKEALEFYRQKYGTGTMVGDYYIRFKPHLDVFEYRPL